MLPDEILNMNPLVEAEHQTQELLTKISHLRTNPTIFHIQDYLSEDGRQPGMSSNLFCNRARFTRAWVGCFNVKVWEKAGGCLAPFSSLCSRQNDRKAEGRRHASSSSLTASKHLRCHPQRSFETSGASRSFSIQDAEHAMKINDLEACVKILSE
eukprot:454969-Hanusia_phi.AAC.2